nr:hypothetical protein [Tanacetum cinerariifolium]
IVLLFDTIPIQQGEGSGTPTEPHHTPSPKAQSPSHTIHTSPTLPPITTTSLPNVTQSDTPIIRKYTRRTKIVQSSVLPNIADKPASPLQYVSQGEACPTDSGFITDQDRATIDKSSTLPHDSAPWVTSPVADEGKDIEGVAATRSGDDSPIKGRSMDEGEAATERISDDSEEMMTVLTSMDAATVLASGVVNVPIGSGSIPTASTPAKEQVPTGSDVVPTGSDVVPTASTVFATATVVTPYKRRKGKEVMVESGSKVQFSLEADGRLIPMGSKEEAKRIKRKGVNLEQESAKKQKTSEEVPEEAMSPEEVLEEKVKEMMQLVPIEEVCVEALQVKHPIIDLKGRLESTMKIVEWKLYDTCGVHHVTSKDKEIFMLVEKDYPLRKGLALVMISYKLQVENYSQMENDQILKIYKIVNSPRQQEQLPTASEEGCHCQKKSKATTRKIALLSKVKKKLVYNRRTNKIMETMNVTFDELSVMSFQEMNSGRIKSGLDLTYASSTITSQKPTECELDLLFQALYDDYIGGQPLDALRTALATPAT